MTQSSASSRVEKTSSPSESGPKPRCTHHFPCRWGSSYGPVRRTRTATRVAYTSTICPSSSSGPTETRTGCKLISIDLQPVHKQAVNEAETNRQERSGSGRADCLDHYMHERVACIK